MVQSYAASTGSLVGRPQERAPFLRRNLNYCRYDLRRRHRFRPLPSDGPLSLKVRLLSPGFPGPAFLRVYLVAVPPVGGTVGLEVRYVTVTHLVNDSNEELVFSPYTHCFSICNARSVPHDWAVALLVEVRTNFTRKDPEFVGMVFLREAGKNWSSLASSRQQGIIEFGCPGASYFSPAPGFSLTLYEGLEDLLKESKRGASVSASEVGAIHSRSPEIGAFDTHGIGDVIFTCNLELDVTNRPAIQRPCAAMTGSSCYVQTPPLADQTPSDMLSTPVLFVYVGLCCTDSGSGGKDSPVSLVRSDTVCPLCFVDCFNHHILACHFAHEHEDYSMSCESVRLRLSNPAGSSCAPASRTVHCYSAVRRTQCPSAAIANPPLSKDPGACEVIYASRSRYPQWYNARILWERNLQALLESSKHNPWSNMETAFEMSGPHVNVTRKDEDRDSDCTDFDADALERDHQPVFKANILDVEGFVPPLQPIGADSMDPETEAKLKDAVRKLSLYHVVTNERVKPGHLEGAQYDSEEDVDNSWKLQIAEDEVKALRDISPKHKALWTLWNRFAFAKGAAGKYGERYTRFSLELFALSCGSEILRLGLRVQFLGFVRALHVHGCLDATGVISVFRCLDGDKKFEDCHESAIPKGSHIKNGDSVSRKPSAGRSKKSNGRSRAKRR